jgi:hypothetical protein
MHIHTGHKHSKNIAAQRAFSANTHSRHKNQTPGTARAPVGDDPVRPDTAASSPTDSAWWARAAAAGATTATRGDSSLGTAPPDAACAAGLTAAAPAGDVGCGAATAAVVFGG